MRVSDLAIQVFVMHPGTGFFQLAEYTSDVPVVVKLSIDVG